MSISAQDEILQRLLVALATAVLLAAAGSDRPGPIQYRFTFPELEHRWMQVEAVFPDVSDRQLELRMSRSSPGRYSAHDFANNIYSVQASDEDGRELALSRSDEAGWIVEGRPSQVRVKYKIYGDLLDGTYLAIDETHAHINMPAVILRARGLDDRPTTLTFTPPAGKRWTAATQLHATSMPFVFTAPNLQYLMDSPIELGPLAVRQFMVGPRVFRFAAHHTGTDAELDSFVGDVQRIVRQEGAVFNEFPDYEPGYYTFVADYLRYATADAMEHRNSTVMTSTGTIRNYRVSLLDTVAHEFFHSWNVERIRPRALEPFDFDRPNLSDELWLAEGFTQYYAPLMLQRAGITDVRTFADTFGDIVDLVTLGAGRAINTPVEMSRMAPFVDGGPTIDRNNWRNTYISYYPYGAAVALALDLTLRERSDGRITLDDYMRGLWKVHGKPGGLREGYVDHPYTMMDAEARLAEVSGDPSFARTFFSRYIEGRDLADFSRLMSLAGFSVHPRFAGRAWWGDVRFELRDDRVYIAELIPQNWPMYAAGIEQDDEVRQVGGVAIRTGEDAAAVIRRHRPGDHVSILYVDRSGAERTASVALVADPHLDVTPIEATSNPLTTAQRAFRERWLAAH